MLSAESLQAKIEKHLQLLGYKKVQDLGYHKQYSDPFIKAISRAVVEEIQQNAQVPDKGPECGGTWKVV